MKKVRQKVIVVLGQTATGKSDFAVRLAQTLGTTTTKYEIISADSRQVYTGLDLGTGKITKKEMKGVPHHLLDVISPKKVFSAATFKELGTEAIKEIALRGNTTIICGGTGFYIDTLLGSVSLPEVPQDEKLRARLEKLSTEKLLAKLEKLDSTRAKTIDRNNRVRIIRAIEIATALGSVPVLKKKELSYDVFFIGLALPDEILRERIHVRLKKRIKIGMIEEAEQLHTQKLSWKRMRELGLEYKYLADFLTKKISKEEMITLLEYAIWHYAKRQKTWFQRNKEIVWIDPREESATKLVVEKVKDFIKE